MVLHLQAFSKRASEGEHIVHAVSWEIDWWEELRRPKASGSKSKCYWVSQPPRRLWYSIAFGLWPRLDVIVKSIRQRDRKFVCVTSRSCENMRLSLLTLPWIAIFARKCDCHAMVNSLAIARIAISTGNLRLSLLRLYGCHRRFKLLIISLPLSFSCRLSFSFFVWEPFLLAQSWKEKLTHNNLLWFSFVFPQTIGQQPFGLHLPNVWMAEKATGHGRSTYT